MKKRSEKSLLSMPDISTPDDLNELLLYDDGYIPMVTKKFMRSVARTHSTKSTIKRMLTSRERKIRSQITVGINA